MGVLNNAENDGRYPPAAGQAIRRSALTALHSSIRYAHSRTASQGLQSLALLSDSVIKFLHLIDAHPKFDGYYTKIKQVQYFFPLVQN